jgi:hypothetical protein
MADSEIEDEFDWSLTEIPQLVLHVNRELIHHGSEICTLTDLYRSRGSRHA